MKVWVLIETDLFGRSQQTDPVVVSVEAFTTRELCGTAFTQATNENGAEIVKCESNYTLAVNEDGSETIEMMEIGVSNENTKD